MKAFFRGIFRFIARLIAAVFAILFILVTVLVLLLLNIEHSLLNAETYKRALAENKIYQQFPALAADEMSKAKSFIANPCAANPVGCAIDGASPELQGCLVGVLGQESYEAIGSGRRNPGQAELQASQSCLDRYPAAKKPVETGSGEQMAYLNHLSAEDWQALLSTLLPADLLQPMTESTLDQVFTYLNGDADTATLSLVQLKKHLSGEAGQEALALILAAQPACTQEQLARMTASISGGQGNIVLCAPPDAQLANLLSGMRAQLNTAIDRIPDQAVIIKPPSIQASPGEGGLLGNDPPAALRIIHQGIRLSPLLPVGLLLLVMLFGVRSRRGWLRWWGFPLFITGLIGVGIALAALPALDWAWLNYVAVRIPPLFSASIPETGHQLARFLVRDLMKWIGLEAGLLGLLGLIAVTASLQPKGPTSEDTIIPVAGEVSPVP